ncbi:uncharacterized protein LOC122020670 [Zingiber officinale]|uniref:Uncharacterized protein n=1 Tax=Zingiber officinale TaxID=94328 RepID=A0A8J5HU56_ZINOF|nr:uncharacterized protein LOC122020670 [Zingiber officinale]KAG6535841.1 hypothetical protein ZIOFF_000870 [Zingiber officinale]
MAALQAEAAHSLQFSPPAASRPPEEPKDGKDDHPFFSWLSLAAFAFLTFNTAIAVRRSIDDPGALAFTVASYVDLLCLFWCLRRFEWANERDKGWLKMAIWLLASLLTGMFSYKVAAVMPWPVAAILWGMNCATTMGGFYAFFLHRENSPVKEGKI